MNRILFEPGEIVGGIAAFGGDRATHVMEILHGEVGQILKTGEVNGLIGTSEIVSIARGADGYTIRAKVDHQAEGLRPWVDLILAPPRPRILKRLLPQLAALGVGHIFLVGAKKVEKDFWGATLLRPENYRPLLIDGLMQAGTSVLPTIETRRGFRKFVADELDALGAGRRRLVAHPYAGSSTSAAVLQPSPDQPLTLAVGPEGGWADEEVALLEAHGFARYSLGARILRTDTATIALLAKLMPTS